MESYEAEVVGKPLARKVVVVTGGSRGIGQAIAADISSAGAAVAILGRDRRRLAQVQTRIARGGGEAIAIEVDVQHDDSVASAIAEVEAKLGPIDILIASAGIQGPIADVVDTVPADWLTTLEVNLLGVVRCCLRVLPSMIARHSGKIVALSGGGAAGPRPGFCPYAVSKAGLVRFVETLAEEVRRHNVQVNAIAPGFVLTDMHKNSVDVGSSERRSKAAESQGPAEDVSPKSTIGLVRYLCSERSLQLSGKLISATHDNWTSWRAEDVAMLASSEWLTLRRIDSNTVGKLPTWNSDGSIRSGSQPTKRP